MYCIFDEAVGQYLTNYDPKKPSKWEWTSHYFNDMMGHLVPAYELYLFETLEQAREAVEHIGKELQPDEEGVTEDLSIHEVEDQPVYNVKPSAV